MSPLATIVVLAGLVGIPALLLWEGQRFRTFSKRRLGAYRGAVVGYAATSVGVMVTLLVPPYTWPPPEGTAVVLVAGLVVGPAVGAILGSWRGRAVR